MAFWDLGASALLSAGSSLLGGLFNSGATERNNQANIQAQKEINAQNLADKEKDRAMQREFAQTGIQWKAADALAAGIHPVYAMGANTVSYAPSAVGLEAPKSEANTSMGSAIASAGQDLSRAAAASSDEETRASTKIATALTLKNSELQNELLATQIAKLRSQIGPSIPTSILSPGGNKIENEKLKQTPEAIPETASLRILGMPIRTNPYSSDAESIENRYGNLGEAVVGATNLPMDLAYTLYKDYPHLIGALGGNYATRKYQEQRRKSGYRPGLE